MSEDKGGSALTAPVFLLLSSCFLTLALTLLVYPTNLNPGLPLMAGGLLTLFWGLYRLFRGVERYYSWGLEIAHLLLIWMALSAWFGLDEYLAQKSLATFVGVLGFLLAPQSVLTRAKQWRLHLHTFLVLVTITAVAAWAMAIQEALSSGTIPPLSGPCNNPDVFSVLPMIGLLAGFGLFERASKKIRFLLYAQIGFFSVTILATGCRAAMLGCLVGSIIFVAILYQNRQSKLERLKPLLVIPFSALLLMIPLMNFGFSVTDKLAQTLNSSGETDLQTTRLEVLWRSPLAVLDNPLLGAGPGCFGRAFQTVRAADHDDLYIDIAHNDHMEMAVEAGVPGFLLWVALLYVCIQKPLSLVESGRRPVAAAAIVGAVGGAASFQLFNFIVAERPALWAMSWLLGLALSFPSSRNRLEEPTPVRLLTLIAGALAVWTMFFGYRAVRSDELRLAAKLNAEALRLKPASRLLDQALEYQPANTQLRRKRAEYARKLGLYQQRDSQFQEALTHLQAAREASPKDILTLLDLAALHTQLGDYKSARAVLEEADLVAPHHHLVMRKLMELALREKRWKDAAKLATSDRVVSPGHRAGIIAPLLQAVELQSPGEGRDLLQTWLNENPGDNWPKELLERMLVNATKSKHWEVALSFTELKMNNPDTKFCAQTLKARIRGEMEGPKAEWSLLSQALKEAEASRARCFETLLTRWIQVGIAQSHSDEVETHLRDLLDSDKRQLKARIGLSGLLSHQGRHTEAIKLAREGLQLHDRSPELLAQVASLYESAGSYDLAYNYYEQASKLSPSNQELKAKMAEVKKKR